MLPLDLDFWHNTLSEEFKLSAEDNYIGLKYLDQHIENMFKLHVEDHFEEHAEVHFVRHTGHQLELQAENQISLLELQG